MADQDKPISFQLPEGRSVDVYLVQLPNGATVARTAEELLALPAGAIVKGAAPQP